MTRRAFLRIARRMAAGAMAGMLGVELLGRRPTAGPIAATDAMVDQFIEAERLAAFAQAALAKISEAYGIPRDALVAELEPGSRVGTWRRIEG